MKRSAEGRRGWRDEQFAAGQGDGAMQETDASSAERRTLGQIIDRLIPAQARYPSQRPREPSTRA